MAVERSASRDANAHINLTEENLFELKCLVRTSGIGRSARCEIGRKQLLAFATVGRDIGLYYHEDIHGAPTLAKIPWYEAPQRAICALCFDPTGSWLLVASIDGSLYVLPALALLEGDEAPTDRAWSVEDVTCFPALDLRSSHSRPTCLAWWQGVARCERTAVVGTERGEIIFVNLENGQQVGSTRVGCGVVTDLRVCRDNSMEIVSLLVTSQSRQQWRVVLERRADNYVYPRDKRRYAAENTSARPCDASDEGKSYPPTRSRLQGLKQLSVEKLAVLRQKLAETRNRNLAGNTKRQDSGSSSGTEDANTPEHASSRALDERLDTLAPEALSGDMFLLPQYTRQGQHLYTGYSDASHHVTIHATEVSVMPFHMYKMPGPCRNVLLTQRLFFVVSTNRRTLRIISCPLCETRIGEDTEFKRESLVARFDLEDTGEYIREIYRSSDYKRSPSPEDEAASRNLENVYSLPTRYEDLRIDLPCVDTCVVVTNLAVYKVVLRRSLLSVFMDLVLKRNDLERAGRLGVVFGMNVQQLLESAGDIFLMNNDCARAMVLYKLSRCRLLKRVLKFAAAGRTAELLSWLIYCLASPTVSELTTTTRIHLSNLSVFAFTELTLRATAQALNNINEAFLLFLSTNTFYDELWAVEIARQTCLWKVLYHLATQRGLYGQVLDILVKTVKSPSSSCTGFMSSQSTYWLLMCVSEPSLVQAILANPNVARGHMAFVHASLPTLPIFVLQRLVNLYDPTNPVLRPLLVRYRARRRTMSQSSQSSQCDSIDSADVLEDTGSLVEEVVETFLLVLSCLVHRKTPIPRHNPLLMQRTHLPGVEKRYGETATNADFKRRLLSAGYAHVALIRNGNVYTWGNGAQGCLGTGPSMSRYGSPQAISLFRNMETEVLSVSCGRAHTLAVTNNGIYAWGSSQYGQLGLGRINQCPSPELVTSLSQEIIVDAVAGQYHSVALTIDGRLFTWGWGVHGQLGHGNTEPRNTPALVNHLLGTVVKHVSAGHAHTLALTADGYVYAFGCNIFGQLGTGNSAKSSLPIRIALLPEKITHIATAYFHNLAVSRTNKLYTWGASPQVLRLQTQAQKKSKILEYQAAAEKFAEAESKAENPSSLADNLPDDENPDEAVTRAPSCGNDNEETRNGPMSKIEKRLADSKIPKSPSGKDLNIGSLEEAQTHLRPTLVSTSLVNGRIVQISTGCHHSALLTKDGTVYTWGRNLDGQIGNGTRREVLVPTPLDYNPASVLAQIPPRSSLKNEEPRNDTRNADEREPRDNQDDGSTSDNYRRAVNRMIKTVKVCCGCDFTVAIQPGGTVLAWGSNSTAQLGRPPTKDSATDEKLVLLKSSRRVVRLPHGAHVAHDTPSQVPNIPTPVISYQSYDVTPLAGRVRPLSVVEKNYGDTTLHYVLEQFYGLYDNAKIADKLLENGDYHACSKLALLEQDYSKSFAYQLKTLNPAAYKESTRDTCVKDIGTVTREEKSALRMAQVKNNTELFDKQVVKNLVDSLEECVTRKKLRMTSSRSLDSFQVSEQELHTFDCQGGSEDLCEDTKSEDISLDLTEDALDPDDENNVTEYNKNLERMRDILVRRNSNRLNLSLCNGHEERSLRGTNDKTWENDERLADNEMDLMLADATRIVKFYMNEIEDTAHTTMREVLHATLEFWIEHELPTDALEMVLIEHINKLFYPLGLLLFCQNAEGERVDANKNSAEIKSLRTMNSLSTKFCLQVCSMLLRHVDQGKPSTEYIELFSLLTAKNYGPPLTGYPGSSENKTAEQMMEGIISTLSSKARDPRPFIHIKEPERVTSFLESDEDTVVFTCGHHYPITMYGKEAIPGMEAELLMAQPLPLPCTAQFLGNVLRGDDKPETLCPTCLPRALQNAVNNRTDR